MKFKFQVENGYIANGYNEIKIIDFVGEVDGPLTPALKLLVESHGGVEVVEAAEKPKAKAKKKAVAK